MMYKSQNTVMTSLVKFSLFLIYMVALSPVNAANHAISASNFSMFDPTGALVGGATDVNGTFDDSQVCNTESCTDFAMTLASDQPFFGVQWLAHDIRVFSEGTYTFDSGCTAAEIQAGTTNCAAPGPTIDLTVGTGQLGAHVLFDYGEGTDIDVVLLWDLDDAFGDPIYDGCRPADPPGACDPTQTPTKPWNLVSLDGDGSGTPGFAMVDGPFPGFNANFNLDITPSTPLVDLSGTVKTDNDLDICAMVLASGKYTFSCNPIGEFSLTGLPRESSGKVKRQIYADGFFPKIDILTESTYDMVVMTRSGTCPSYNQPYTPGTDTGSAGKRIDISGKVLAQDSSTPICAMVLANGQYMFSCDGTGSYALNIPLDANGQFKLQVYADGFAPTIQRFDEVKATNDVRMARAAECQ